MSFRKITLTFVRGLRTERSRVIRALKALQRRNELSKIIGETSSVSEGNAAFDERIEANVVTAENQHERLAAAVTPLAGIPYEEQLTIKWQRSDSILKELRRRLQQEELPAKVKKKRCVLHRIVPSPAIEDYRNKDEFRIKTGIDGDPKTVGFLIGNVSQGNAICVNPDRLINTKSSHKKIASAFQAYIRDSPLAACDLFSDGGHWRGINVRSNLSGDLMATVVLHPQNLSEEELMREKSLLSSYFSSGPGGSCNLKSLYFQACRHTRCSSEQAPYDLLFGDEHIYEQVGSMKFRISPDSFFQVNTLAAEYLHKAVSYLCPVDANTILLDICSGTGTISLPLASDVRAVIGIEMNKQAVADASFNAHINDVKNATFVNGKAELILPQIVPSLDMHNVVAVVNPSRAGLHPDAVYALRACTKLERVIYVSCKPDGEALVNFYFLGKPPSGKLIGDPFVATRAVPLDMFPHTEHCELIVLFERMKL